MSTTGSIRNFRVEETTGRYVATRPLTQDQIITAARTLLKREGKRRTGKGPRLSYGDQVENHFLLNLGKYEHEVFACLFVDSSRKMLAFDEMFRGSLREARVYPREIVRRALELNAFAVHIGHNHPSGDLKMSLMDAHLTHAIDKALRLVDVWLEDHTIVGHGEARIYHRATWPEEG